MGSAGLPCDRLVRDEMRSLLAVFIREQLARGRRVVLQIDDADKLGPAAFGELLRLWRVARTADAAPELLLCLVHLDHGSSAAADFVRSTPAPAVTVLSWLNSTEISWYIHWRMQRFELMDMFSEAAIRLIGQCTHGCYLAIDHICQMTLLLLRNRECERADVLLVREAMRTLSRQKRSREADAAAEAQAELFVTRDGALLHQVALGDRLVIGRSPLNDIALDSAFVSRHHLAITRGATGYYVSDMNSVNGVLLNGQRVKSAPLGNGDLIGIGNYRLKFIVTGEVLRFAEDDPDGLLTETSVMPTPEIPEPAYLKVIK
jgi:hypothetical protein